VKKSEAAFIDGAATARSKKPSEVWYVFSFIAGRALLRRRLDHNVIEIHCKPAVRKRLPRLGQYFLIGIAAGNVR
jgi:hypothetical protein